MEFTHKFLLYINFTANFRLFSRILFIKEQPFLVENETNRIFAKKEQMIPLLTEIIHKERRSDVADRYGRLDECLAGHEAVQLEKGFFFLLALQGHASLEDTYRTYSLSQHSLVVLTPSTRSLLKEMSADFAVTGLYLYPDYFDSLPDGQALYNQVVCILGGNSLPVFTLGPDQAQYLKDTFSLFSRHLAGVQLYRDGMIRHLCSFLLLQITENLCALNTETTVSVSRSNEIFRQFKKLLSYHYKEQHAVSYYAACLNISPTYLSRVVKNASGHTVGYHVSELLCADARRMLESTDLDVKEIAVALGFSDQSVFGKFFVRKMGMSPLKFRMRRDVLREEGQPVPERIA